MAVRSALRRPALAFGHLSHPAWGAARWSITARPRPLRGVSHIKWGLGPRDPGGPRGVNPHHQSAGPCVIARGRRMQARGAPLTQPRPPSPDLQPRPRRSYLVWARAAVRAGDGERGWSAEEATRPGHCCLSGSL